MAQNFQADMRIGMKAEMEFKKYLESKGLLVVHIKGWWKWFDLMTLTFPIVTYEVKNDSYTKETGNLCLELWSHKPLKKEGWVKYTKADYIIYFISEKEYYKIPTQQLRDYINNPEKIKGKRIVSGWGKGNYNVENLLVPVKELNLKVLRTDK